MHYLCNNCSKFFCAPLKPQVLHCSHCTAPVRVDPIKPLRNQLFLLMLALIAAAVWGVLFTSPGLARVAGVLILASLGLSIYFIWVCLQGGEVLSEPDTQRTFIPQAVPAPLSVAPAGQPTPPSLSRGMARLLLIGIGVYIFWVGLYVFELGPMMDDWLEQYGITGYPGFIEMGIIVGTPILVCVCGTKLFKLARGLARMVKK